MWDVWAELRSRRHITLEWADLGDELGRIDAMGRQVTITLHYRLNARDRRAVLAHELVHDERGILFDDDSPSELVQCEERAVRREVARRLCPPADLERRVRSAVADGQAVCPADVSEWFDVPDDVATEALMMHGLTLAATHVAGHPSAEQPRVA